MQFKTFQNATLAGLQTDVNTWLGTGNFYCYSNSFNMVPDGSGGEDFLLMIFYIEK
jgi:hypothetical protein